jgi:hypothetical protein
MVWVVVSVIAICPLEFGTGNFASHSLSFARLERSILWRAQKPEGGERAMAQRDDVQELREVFTALQETAMPLLRELMGLLPELVRQVYAVFYSEETAQQLGRSIGAYFRSLQEAGLPETMCQELTLRYAENANASALVNLLRSALRGEALLARPKALTEGEAFPAHPKALPEE